MAIVNFVWDALSDNVLKETDNTGSTVTTYTNAPSQFGETLSQNQTFGDTYFHYDALGCTRNLTAQNETVVRTNIYTGFGETVSSTGLHSTKFGWNGAAGYYTDEETGDFYVRRRTYNPDTGRWRSRDPLGFVDGPNVYAYVRNQPIALIDLTGMISQDDWGNIDECTATEILFGLCGDGGGPTPPRLPPSRQVCCKYGYKGQLGKSWVREQHCTGGRTPFECCVRGLKSSWEIIEVSPRPCKQIKNCTRDRAKSVACCSLVIAFPDNPTDVVGTPVGGILGIGALITAACCVDILILQQLPEPEDDLSFCHCYCPVWENLTPTGEWRYWKDVPKGLCEKIGCRCQ